MEIDILSLFPGYFTGPFDESMLRRARERGLLSIRHVDIRDFAQGKHRRVDDRPYGGGPGMVLKAEPVVGALRSVRRPHSRTIFLSPQGERLTAQKGRELARESHLVLLCGHYEGIDERILAEGMEEISIGEYVLTNGALAAIVLIDVVARFIPGVLGHPEAAMHDSFEEGELDHPHYTVPRSFEGREVPEVLLNGNHREIAAWREEERRRRTQKREQGEAYGKELHHRRDGTGEDEKAAPRVCCGRHVARLSAHCRGREGAPTGLPGHGNCAQGERSL